jgi:regulator of replication initiation timing
MSRAPDVRRHDDDGVLEVDLTTVVVRQMSLVEHLQQDVEHVRMRLLDLVEQDHRVRLAPDRLRQRPGILVARRSPAARR